MDLGYVAIMSSALLVGAWGVALANSGLASATDSDDPSDVPSVPSTAFDDPASVQEAPAGIDPRVEQVQEPVQGFHRTRTAGCGLAPFIRGIALESLANVGIVNQVGAQAKPGYRGFQIVGDGSEQLIPVADVTL